MKDCIVRIKKIQELIKLSEEVLKRKKKLEAQLSDSQKYLDTLEAIVKIDNEYLAIEEELLSILGGGASRCD